MTPEPGIGQGPDAELTSKLPPAARDLVLNAWGGYEGVLDPYLGDALEELDRVILDLALLRPEQPTFAAFVEDCAFMACEISRDATIRMIPLNRTTPRHLAVAEKKCRAVLALLARHEATGRLDHATAANIGKYRTNIQKRLDEYAQALPAPVPSASAATT